MATDVTTGEARLGATGPAEDEQKRRPYRRRFIIVYVVCALAVIAGIVALVFVATDDNSKSTKSGSPFETGQLWSKWQPKGTTLSSVSNNIAQHLSAKYEGLKVSALPVSRDPIANEPPIIGVDFRSRFGTFTQPRRLVFRYANRMWMYELCGQDSSCQITSGTSRLPGNLNHLVGKEMLELALYTLKYEPKLDSVLILLPASDSNAPAFYLHRKLKDVRTALDRPLVDTVPPGTEQLGTLGTRLLSKRLWVLNTNQIRQLTDSSIILELDKPPAQGG